MRLSYEEWVRRVDASVERKVGLSIHELPDVPLRDWYDDGVTSGGAATRAIREAGGDF